ncbi:hypothetical protein CKA32_002091 [Geitlerinema sp. FC II]|nr:hypothetical protein CKA32_002091 [Geitlerinema sp. FC II]
MSLLQVVIEEVTCWGWGVRPVRRGLTARSLARIVFAFITTKS